MFYCKVLNLLLGSPVLYVTFFFIAVYALCACLVLKEVFN